MFLNRHVRHFFELYYFIQCYPGDAILVQRPTCKQKQMDLKPTSFKEKHMVTFKDSFVSFIQVQRSSCLSNMV